MKRYIDNIIMPFVTQKRQELKLRPTHPAIAIFDNFRGQTTGDILSHLRSYNIVPFPNCTDKLPLDILVNKPKTDFSNGMHKK